MVYVGLTLQILGILLILMGGFRAARQMGAVERWWTGGKLWAVDRVRGFGALVRRLVLGKGKPVVVSPATIKTRSDVLQAHGVVTEPPWEEMDHDEQLAMIRRRLDALRDLVDRNAERAGGRLDAVEERLAEFESTVDKRFVGHDVRDQTILGYELAGGAVSLLGTVIGLLA